MTVKIFNLVDKIKWTVVIADGIVSFYDAMQFNGKGQFVSRYHLEALLAAESGSGLMLDTGSENWSLTAEGFAKLAEMLTSPSLNNPSILWLKAPDVASAENATATRMQALALADTAFENFEFPDHFVVDFDGWSYTSVLDEFTRNVFLQAKDGASDSSVKAKFTAHIQANKVVSADYRIG